MMCIDLLGVRLQPFHRVVTRDSLQQNASRSPFTAEGRISTSSAHGRFAGSNDDPEY